MALRWHEGFEALFLPTLMLRKYAAGGTFVTAGGNPVGWQGKGFACDSQNTSGSGYVDLTTRALVVSPENSWIMGWAWQMNDVGGLSGSQTTFPGMNLHNSVGQQLQFEMVAYNSESKPGGFYWRLQVRRGSTVLGTSDKIFELGKWYYIEVKATVRTGTNGSFAMRWWGQFDNSPTVDTFQGATLTGINTANQGTDGADRMRMLLVSLPQTGSADLLYLDDVYVCDSTGSINNDYLGKQMIEALHPDGTGNAMQWDLAGSATSIADALAEARTSQSTPGDDRRITSDVTDERALATYDPLTFHRLNTIRGVLLHTEHRMDTSGSRSFVPLLRKTTGTPAEVEGTSVLLSSTSVTGSSEVFEVDPNTGAVWTVTNINAAEFGVKTKA